MRSTVRGRLIIALAVVAVVGGVVALSWPDATASSDPEITVARSSCGQGWTDPKPGPQTFRLHNTGSVTAEVYLIDPGTGAVYAEVEGLGAGTTRPMSVTLGNGAYAFRCLPDAAPATVGPVSTLSGDDVRSGPAVAPVTNADLIGPVKAYHRHITAGLVTFGKDTAALKAAVERGDRAASQATWLTAHLSYERLGAAYDAFGDVDGALNGTADGLAGGTADPDFTGFHRLEYGLWHNEDMGALTSVARRLDTDARSLVKSFADSQIDQNDLGLRAHEIMENALQFELTGRTDYGSGTNLATARANLDGTRAVLDVLRPLLAPRFPGLSDVDTWLDRTQTALDKAHRADGGWTPLARLDQRHRQTINGAVGELTERLASIAAIAAPRRVS